MIVENSKRVCFPDTNQNIAVVSLWEGETTAHIQVPEGEMFFDNDCIRIENEDGYTIYVHLPDLLTNAGPMYEGTKRSFKVIEVLSE